MPITITISANNAVEAKQLVHDLAYAIFRLPAEEITDTEVSTVEEAGGQAAPTAAQAPADPRPVAQAAPTPAKTAPTPTTEPAPQPAETTGDLFDDEPIPTDVELREIARKIGITPERKAAVKELLAKYGVQNITAVPPEKRIAFKRDLEAMAL